MMILDIVLKFDSLILTIPISQLLSPLVSVISISQELVIEQQENSSKTKKA